MHESPGQKAAIEIRAEMARQRKTQVQLVSSLGRNADWWSKRLLGKQPMSVDDLLALTTWLGMDPAELLPRVAA